MDPKRLLWPSLTAVLMTVAGCSDDDRDFSGFEARPTAFDSLSFAQRAAVDYFADVALGFESDVLPDRVRKFLPGEVVVAVTGSGVDPMRLAVVDEVIAEVNILASDGVVLRRDSAAAVGQATLVLGDVGEAGFGTPSATELRGLGGYFKVNHNLERGELYSSRAWVNTALSQAAVRSLIYEELTQSLGIGRDSPRYPESIFYETSADPGFAQEYAGIDRQVIRLLYHPRMRVGAYEDEARLTAARILLEE